MSKRKQQHESGQSLVEVALALPILLLILAGLLDLGRVFYTFIALEEAAAEGALYLAINPDCPTASSAPTCTDPNNAIFRATNAGNQEVDWSIATLTPEVTEPTIGFTVRFTVEYPFEFITPGIEEMANAVTNNVGLVLRVTATQLILFE